MRQTHSAMNCRNVICCGCVFVWKPFHGMIKMADKMIYNTRMHHCRCCCWGPTRHRDDRQRWRRMYYSNAGRLYSDLRECAIASYVNNEAKMLTELIQWQWHQSVLFMQPMSPRHLSPIFNCSNFDDAEKKIAIPYNPIHPFITKCTRASLAEPFSSLELTHVCTPSRVFFH